MVRKRDVDDLRIAARLRAGDPLAREAMIRRYLPLARRLAWRYCHTGEPMEDLVQVASLGLVKAVDRWDPDRGFVFTSFAVPTMLGELRRHFRDAGWLVRPPRDLQELALAVERAIGPLSATLGHAPGAAELAQRLGRSPEAVLEAMQASQGRSARPLDEEPLDDPDEPLAAVSGSAARTPATRPRRRGPRWSGSPAGSMRGRARSCAFASTRTSSSGTSPSASAAPRCTCRASSAGPRAPPAPRRRVIAATRGVGRASACPGDASRA